MRDLTKDQNISEHAVFVLNEIALSPITDLCIVGGVALNHYVSYRKTRDIDTTWINGEPSQDTLTKLDKISQKLAKEFKLNYKRNTSSYVESFNFYKEDQKVFNIDCSIRNTYKHGKNLKSPEKTQNGIAVESLHDNILSKISALIDRGVPRDITDTLEIVRKTGISFDEIMKNAADFYGWNGKLKAEKLETIEHNIIGIFKRRPLKKVKNPKKLAKNRVEIVRILLKKELDPETNTIKERNI
jgi:predicted nucleotidyltransferase component of viral defense system